MASESIIELGSSEDEAEPATKKRRADAMVIIPNRLCEVKKVKRPKPVNLQVNKAPETAQKVQSKLGEQIVVTKVNPLPIKPLSFKKVQKIGAPILPVVSKIHTVRGPLPQYHGPVFVNPHALKGQSSRMNLPPRGIHIKNTVGNANIRKKVMNPIRLPSSITITRTAKGPNKPIGPKQNVPKKFKPNPRAIVQPAEGSMVTVDLDDEDTPQASSGPQWYLKPEEHEKDGKVKPTEETQEQINNAEPEPSKMIEITIEDSPIKPVLQNKRKQEVGNESVITIEDSPGKSAHSTTAASGNVGLVRKEYQSKKQLQYPNDTPNNSIEIEIEPMESTLSKMNGNATNKEPDPVFEVLESPKKKLQNETSGTNNQSEPQTCTSKDAGEFHPVYQNFIDLCLEMENSDDMNKIVEKKIKAYYRQTPKEYTCSEEFIDMVSTKILCMKSGPEKLYLFIKDIVDELNIQRKMAKTHVQTKDTEADKFLYGEESEFDSKRQRQIRKLEKTLKKLHRAIQKLEEQEVDFDDDEDSVYLLTDRYKERMVRVHAKFCQLTNTKMPSEPRVYIDPRPGRPTGPAKRLEKWINKKVPIGKPLPFPDFHDVLKCVRDANTEDKLRWNEAEIMDEAHDLFSRCGKKLQRRRQENEWRLAASRIASETDPADASEELKKKLDENQLIAVKKESEIYQKFAERQNILKLEAEEIGDKEAEESPIESEEEEEPIENESNLEDKEKRKEKLRKIVSETCKKSGSEKDVRRDIMIDKDPLAINGNENENKDNNTADDKQSEKVRSKDSNEVDSDIDKHHLLQKKNSDKEGNSSGESSEADSPINLTDSYASDSDEKAAPDQEVISIENSSESEVEDNNVDSNDEAEQSPNTNDDESVDSNPGSAEDVQIVGDIPTECININEDSISIGDTVVGNQEKVVNETGVDAVSNEKEKDDSHTNEKPAEPQPANLQIVTSQDPKNVEVEVEKAITETDTNTEMTKTTNETDTNAVKTKTTTDTNDDQDKNIESVEITDKVVEVPIEKNESESLDLQIEVSNICTEEIFKDSVGECSSRVEDADKDDSNLSDILEEMQSDLNSYDQVTST